MKKIFFYQLSVILKWFTLFGIVAVLGACGSVPIPPIKMDNQTVNIGYSSYSNGYNILVENTGTQWTIKKISGSSLQRTNDSQEILFINNTFDYVSPAFISADKNEIHDDYYLCSWSGNGYSPCGNTKLTVVDSTSTVTIGALAAIFTYGGSVVAGTHFKTINRNMVSKIIKETDLITIARAFAEYRDKLQERHADISNTAKWDVRVTDKSGFYTTRNIDFSSMIQKGKFSFKRLGAEYMTVNGSANQFKIALQSRLKNELLHYKVPLACPSNTRYNSFDLQFSKCPEFIDASPPRQPVSVEVIVKSKDFSNIYPAFSGKDRNLSVEFDGSKVRITNNVNKYIKLLSTSIYYNKVVETSEDKSLNSLIGIIPPEGFTEEGISSLGFIINSPIAKLVDYPNMTTAKAQGKKIKFGFAIRYQVGDSEQYETFFKTKKYKLVDVLLAGNE